MFSNDFKRYLMYRKIHIWWAGRVVVIRYIIYIYLIFFFLHENSTASNCDFKNTLPWTERTKHKKQIVLMS